MIGIRHCTLFWLLALTGCASIPPHAPEDAITVSRRGWFAICVGICPEYDVTVQGGGRVWAVRRSYGAPDWVIPLRLSPARAARFRAILEPYRPARGDPEDLQCVHDVPPEEAQLVMKVTEFEIKWSDGRHLIACDTPDNRPLRDAIDEALKSVGLGMTAYPLR